MGIAALSLYDDHLPCHSRGISRPYPLVAQSRKVAWGLLYHRNEGSSGMAEPDGTTNKKETNHGDHNTKQTKRKEATYESEDREELCQWQVGRT